MATMDSRSRKLYADSTVVRAISCSVRFQWIRGEVGFASLASVSWTDGGIIDLPGYTYLCRSPFPLPP